MFDRRTKDKIQTGEKRVTRRLVQYKKDGTPKQPCILGKEYNIKIDRTKNNYGVIRPVNYKMETVVDIAWMSDDEAKLEGFDSSMDYWNYFMNLHKGKGLCEDTAVWRIEFEYLGESN